MRDYDTILIGAGPSGLAAGLRLALFQERVLLLEQHTLWGGSNSFYKKGGRLFDVGLHALTNWAPPGARGKPLTKLLRQLRLRHEELRLGEQSYSEIAFPGLRLRFSNDFEELRQGVADAFPRAADAFDALVERVRTEDVTRPDVEVRGARAILEATLGDPLLVDALMLPVCYYGSAREDDCDWDQFVILFRSLFLEGFCRPDGGVRPFLKLLVDRFREAGGELRLRAGVRRVLLEGGRAVGVELEDGTRLTADRVLSSAGYPETMALCGEEVARERVDAEDRGRLGFVESLSVLDRPPAQLGYGATITFFNRTDRFEYRAPEEPVDVRSGVVATPNNYAAENPPAEGLVRVTSLAAHGHWQALDEPAYRAEKERWVQRAIDAACQVVPDFRAHVVARDAFTPRTVEHYTRRHAGAIYGSPRKRRDGTTGIDGLYLIGTDQGFLGVIGAMVSGISIANRHALQASVAGGATA